MTTMTSYERIEAAFRMEEPDRVPVAPIINYMIPYLADMTVHEMFFEPEKVVQAHRDFDDLLGDFVDSYAIVLNHLSMIGRAGWDQVTLDWRIYEHFPPEGNIPNLFEKPVIEDYDEILENGFAPLLFNRKLENEVWERSVDDFLFFQYEYPERWRQLWAEYTADTGRTLLKGGRACHPLDMLQYYRGIYNLTSDLYEQPEKVKRMCEWLTEYEAVRAMKDAMDLGAGEVPGADVIFFVNGGPPGMSRDIYEEFYWPYAKQMVDICVSHGFKVWNHWDNDHTPFLDLIKTITDGLPKGKMVMDFEKTDMKQAKEVLGGTVCIYGNVPSSLMVYGEPEEIDAYCKQLIEDCAEGGGFILGGECEVPWDSKPENVHAMIAAAEKYGQY